MKQPTRARKSQAQAPLRRGPPPTRSHRSRSSFAQLPVAGVSKEIKATGKSRKASPSASRAPRSSLPADSGSAGQHVSKARSGESQGNADARIAPGRRSERKHTRPFHQPASRRGATTMTPWFSNRRAKAMIR